MHGAGRLRKLQNGTASTCMLVIYEKVPAGVRGVASGTREQTVRGCFTSGIL